MSAGKIDRKALAREFRETASVGGVYAIVNRIDGTRLVLSTTTISKAQNALDFAKATGSCVDPRLAESWRRHGGGAFECEILETLEKKPEQTEGEFREEIKVLEGLWRERLAER